MMPKATYVPPPNIEGTITIEVDLSTARWLKEMLGDVLDFTAPSHPRVVDAAISRWGQCSTEFNRLRSEIGSALKEAS